MTDQETRVPAQGCEDTSAACGAGGRREFLGAAVAAVATALTGCGKVSSEEFLQHNFRELSKDEVAQVIARLEKEYKDKFRRTSRSPPRSPSPA